MKQSRALRLSAERLAELTSAQLASVDAGASTPTFQYPYCDWLEKVTVWQCR